MTEVKKRSSGARVGRRPGPSSTRDEILRVARRRFAEVGYDRATFRNIAAEAGVDPALVVQFFGSKRDLFATATVSPVTLLELSEEPQDASDNAGPGLGLARLLMRWLDDQGAREALLARIRSASSEPVAADAVREMIGGQLTAFGERMGGERPDVRASLLGTQFLGVVFARFVVAVEPLASMDGEEIADWLGPTFDLYLTGSLDDSS